MRPVTDQQECSPWRARLWALLEAFGAASAMIDPSGLAAAQRLRALQERRRAAEEFDAGRAGSTRIPVAGQAGRQRPCGPVSPAWSR